MARKYDIYPPVDNRRVRFRQRFVSLLVNVLVLIGAAVLYYLVFSWFFDTPVEHRLRQRAALLKSEYGELVERLAEMEEVLDNVEDRDRNVFNILFEAEPYESYAGYGMSHWSRMETLSPMTNNELNSSFVADLDDLEYRLAKVDGLFARLSDNMKDMGDGMNNIPAIQPVINGELTLLTASFGMRIHPFNKILSQHDGVDFTVPEGSRVFATADGVVKDAIRRSSSTGFTIIIDHGNGYETTYSHLQDMLVRKGQSVSRGDIIALTGNTGLSLVPHLHYEVRHKGVAVDPVHYFFMELTPVEYQRMIRIARSGMQSFD